MIKWNYAYRAARKGPWEEMARDRDRFRGRVHRTGQILNPILTAEHRESIWHNRFANDESANVMEEVENSME
uniref:Protein DP71L n=1 Tax=Bracon brevicornis TaxID=1563983 RepID=A0A6V7L7C9_9HYME